MSNSLAYSFSEQLKNQAEFISIHHRQLVIAHDNPSLIARLAAAFEDAFIVECPQSQWNLGGSEFVEAIGGVANASDIKEVVFVGDSSAATNMAEFKMDKSLSVFERAKVATTARVKSQHDFVSQVDQLCASSAFANLVERHALNIRALFYRCESDAFVVHRVERKLLKTQA